MRKKEIEKSEMFNTAYGKIEQLNFVLKNLNEDKNYSKSQLKQFKEYENEIEKYKSVLYCLYLRY